MKMNKKITAMILSAVIAAAPVVARLWKHRQLQQLLQPQKL